MIRLLTQYGNVMSFKKEKEAQEEQDKHNNAILLKTREDLEDVPTKLLILAYNKITGEKVKKFSSREETVEQAWQAIESHQSTAPAPGKPEAPAPDEVKDASNKKKPKVAAAKKPSQEKEEQKERKQPGRESLFKGKRIYPTKLGLEAARHPNSRRTQSFAVIEANPGLTYEEYKERGGHESDLSIIVTRRNHAIVLDASAKAPKTPPVVDDPKGIAKRKAEREAQNERQNKAKEERKAANNKKEGNGKAASTKTPKPSKSQTPGKAGNVPSTAGK